MSAPIGVGADLGLMTHGDTHAWATFSPCGRYRYALARLWDDYYEDRWDNSGRPILVACCLNPSTADHRQADPTLRKLIHYAKRDRFGGLLLGNVYALRSTDPRALLEAKRAGDDPVGPHNREVVRRLLNAPMLAKAAAGWGPPKWKALEWDIHAMAASGPYWRCWHVTKGGYPGHPLYLKNDAPLVPLFDHRASTPTPQETP